MSEDDMRASLTALSTQIRAKTDGHAQGLDGKEQERRRCVLLENKSKEGVVALPSGLQYKVLKAGDGPKPTASDSVVCNYKERSSTGRNSTAPSNAVNPPRSRSVV